MSICNVETSDERLNVWRYGFPYKRFCRLTANNESRLKTLEKLVIIAYMLFM